jgi:hypothetical protein
MAGLLSFTCYAFCVQLTYPNIVAETGTVILGWGLGELCSGTSCYQKNGILVQ